LEVVIVLTLNPDWARRTSFGDVELAVWPPITNVIMTMSAPAVVVSVESFSVVFVSGSPLCLQLYKKLEAWFKTIVLTAAPEPAPPDST